MDLDQAPLYGQHILMSVFFALLWCLKETKSATMSIFRKKSFLFKSFVKEQLS